MTRKNLKAGEGPFQKAKRKTAAKPKATAKPKTRAKATAKAKPAPTVITKSAESADKRRNNGQFGKGNRANPGGRPKEVAEVRELAKQHTITAINRLVELMADENGRTAVSACNALLDRGWGKATQPLSNDPENPITPILNVQYGNATRNQPASA